MTNDRRNMIVLTIIFFVIQVGVLILLINRGDYGFVYNVLAVTCFWAIFTFAEIKYDLCLDNYIRTAVIITIACDSVLGYYLHLYVTSDVYDRMQHIFGTYAFALLAYTSILHINRQPLQRGLAFILVVALGISLGTVFEIIEFLGDTALKPVLPNQSSLTDTNLDLISDVTGAIIAGCHVILKTSKAVQVKNSH